jgi:adenylyl-sulfate kinase
VTGEETAKNKKAREIFHGLCDMDSNTKNITPHKNSVSSEERARILGQKPCTIWLTGLSASGKSSLAYALERALTDAKKLCYVLDGDNVRHGLNRDLSFSPQDRTENIRRIAEVSRMMNDAGLIVVSSFISPYRADRQMASEIIGRHRFVEVHMSASLESCEKRDPKGLYAKARSGLIKDFTGISSAYEPPTDAALTIDISRTTVEESVSLVLTHI